MQLLSARRAGSTFRYRVHLDETKLDAAGQPDPAFILENGWSTEPRGPSETVAAYTARLTVFEAMARREMRLLCQARLAILAPAADVSLAGEGEPFV